MKRTLGIGMVILGLGASASAEVVHENYTVKGDALSASWHWTDGCVHTSVYVSGGEQRFRAAGGVSEETAWVTMQVARFDRCTFELTELWGDTIGGGVEIDGTTGGTVDTSITLQGQRCGNGTCEELGPEPFDVFAELTGTGEVTTGRSVSTARSGRNHWRGRYSGKNREATATGSFVFDGTELFVGDAFARLETVTTGTQTISHR